ncbi:filamentous hemagglutinin protein, partial [Pasteurella multocida 1500C]
VRRATDELPGLLNQGKTRTVNNSTEHLYAEVGETSTQVKAIDGTYAMVERPRAKSAENEYAIVAEPRSRKVRRATD